MRLCLTWRDNKTQIKVFSVLISTELVLLQPGKYVYCVLATEEESPEPYTPESMQFFQTNILEATCLYDVLPFFPCLPVLNIK